MYSLAGKTVFVTGASSGIGEACVRLFARSGSRVLFCARRLERLKELKAELPDKPGAHFFSLDVRDRTAVENVLAALPQEWRDIDVLVNNAGLAAGKEAVQNARVEDWEQMVDTNIKGLLYVTRALVPSMVKRNSGHIINIGSIAGHEPYQGGSVYCATKSAVRSMSRAFKMDLIGTEVRVSCVDPGAVETEFSLVRFKGDTGKASAVYQGMTPLSAEDVADAVYYCATRPPHVNVSEMLLMATDQVSATAVHRKA